ncbi:Trm112 family protein [Colwellia sp. MSW7]|jgi:uncharacterized protein YbaR (Trm112 family)|uniref:UPF0434 protein L3081_21600 n=1 Tax=Colwellia maritima TaxID=2912588 RepID=A0ABS9X5L1_9GAMM|nr:Trm112 family protein [Colwellia maritima]MCI2285514.1 Trm112 family protein [Colwellia maritima]
MAFDTKLLEILACPVCKGKLDYNKEQQELICKFDKLAYAIDQDIPVLLESEARRINQDDAVDAVENINLEG